MLIFVYEVSSQLSDASLCSVDLEVTTGRGSKTVFTENTRCLTVTALYSFLEWPVIRGAFSVTQTPKLSACTWRQTSRWTDMAVWQVPSYFYGQNQSIYLLRATELLLNLSLGHSQVCKLLAANLDFVIRPPMVVFMVVSVFNSMLAILCLSGFSHSFWCLLWLFCEHHVYGFIYTIFFSFCTWCKSRKLWCILYFHLK